MAMTFQERHPLHMGASDHSKAASPDPVQKKWYHGELTRYDANSALKATGRDCFLIRRQGALVLSLISRGRTCHIKILHGAGWYCLSWSPKSFSTLQNLVTHYRIYPISSEFGTLGIECEKLSYRHGTQGG